MRKTVFEHFKIKNDIADGCMRFALRLSAGLLAALVLSAAGCNDKNSSIMPDVTLPPHGFRVDSTEPTAGTYPTVDAASTFDAAPTGGIMHYDALGKEIRDTEHFEQYLRFVNFRVFEEGDGTFVDGMVINSYPETLFCAVNIIFTDTTEGGSEAFIASGSMQSADGSFMLKLEPGENLLFATVLTDTALTDKPFTLEFDASVGVQPGH